MAFFVFWQCPCDGGIKHLRACQVLFIWRVISDIDVAHLYSTTVYSIPCVGYVETAVQL